MSPVPIFISYSHRDAEFLRQLETNLKALELSQGLEVWSDHRCLEAGDLWRAEIDKALSRAKIAILLVSPDFLASDFICDNELSPLVCAAKTTAVRLVWIPVRPSLVATTDVANFQSVWSPERPLSSLSRPDRESAWVEICQEILAISRPDEPPSEADEPVQHPLVARPAAPAPHVVKSEKSVLPAWLTPNRVIHLVSAPILVTMLLLSATYLDTSGHIVFVQIASVAAYFVLLQAIRQKVWSRFLLSILFFLVLTAAPNILGLQASFDAYEAAQPGQGVVHLPVANKFIYAILRGLPCTLWAAPLLFYYLTFAPRLK